MSLVEITTPTPAAATAPPTAAGLAPVFAMLVAVFIWGGSFTATKASVTQVPPVAFALARFILAASAMGMVQLLTRTPLRIPRELWGVAVWTALLGTTGTYTLENIALQFTTSGNSSLLIAIAPLLTVLTAVLFLGEHFTLKLGVGAGLAAVGVAALVGRDLGHTGIGDAIMGVTTVMGVAYGLLSKRLADAVNPLTALTVTFAIGAAGLVPCALVEAWLAPHAVQIGWGVLGAWAYLGLGSSCVACWLWMYALGHMPASRASLYLYLMPLVTLVEGHFILGERLGWDTGAEALLILVGVYLSSTAETRAPAQLV